MTTEEEIARLEERLAATERYASGGGYKERKAAIEARLEELRNA